MMPFAAYASVILDLRLDKVLDYGIPDELIPLAQRGMRVEVPVRGKPQLGYILKIKEKPDFNPVKPILRYLGDFPLIPEDLFELALWTAGYYCAHLRDVFRLILPPAIRKGMNAKEQLFVMRGKTREETAQFCIEQRNKKPAQVTILDAMLQVKKGILLTKLLEETKGSRQTIQTLEKDGWLSLNKVGVDRSPLINEEYFITKPKILNSEQTDALKKITESLKVQKFETHLLHGVTGSGKTEVYLQAIDQALKLNKGVIMLVPEIALTNQTIERFRSRFQEKIAILHHRLSHGERHDEWHHIRSGRAKIVIGARSAVFSPVVNLGLIIVDEEHEQSYKQNELAPCYHGRDVAVMRGKLSRAAVVLGSATPSLDSYYNVQKGKYQLSVLKQRADSASMPKVTIVDMKREMEKAKGLTHFSDALLNGIKQRVEKGEQTILFLNRRGYHTQMHCPGCQQTVKCIQCDLSLTFHLSENHLACHLCDYQINPPPQVCPHCKSSKTLKFRGAGTEQIQKALHAIFPGIRTLRMDADTTKHKGSHQKILREFGTGKADLLIGTQMIAKGLHFSEVTLVGILNSDSGINIPDFRAAETTFQLITQVAGRSGRGISKGEVIIQTCMPDNSTILHASNENYAGFYEEEMAVRQLFRYPPFTHMAKIMFSGKDPQTVVAFAERIQKELKNRLPDNFEFHPVVPCGYAKIKENYRFQFLMRAPSMQPLNQAIHSLKITIPSQTVKMSVDVNPTSTFF